MPTIRALLHQRQARAAVAIWAIVPTVFLFFALTLAVDPTAHLDRLRVGVAVLDEGVATPDGQVAIGPRLVEGLGTELRAEIVSYPTEDGLTAAVLARDVNLGLTVPAGMTEAVMAGQSAQLQVVRSDANDAFVNAFSANLPAVMTANLATALPAIAGGEAPTGPAVSVTTQTVATSTDFRFAALPATLLLPLWMASVAFAALIAMAGDRVRATFGAVRTGLAELAVATVASAVVAAVIVADIALFTWRADLDLVGLFAFMWLGLLAISWLVLGGIRLVGFGLGVALGILALFIQQPVSGAAFPASFAPDVVRWAEPIAPLRYLVEGMRNLLIGGTTTTDMAVALAALALVGAALAIGGIARLTFVAQRTVRHESLVTA